MLKSRSSNNTNIDMFSEKSFMTYAHSSIGEPSGANIK